MNRNFQYLIQLFRKLPGVGPRQAARFVLALLEKPQNELGELGTAIAEMKSAIRFCQECFNLAENHLCGICTDNRRNPAQLMVMEKITDLASIERTGLYRGLYHVLGGAIDPVDGILAENLHMRELQKRVSAMSGNGKPLELILATNTSTAGETTALYLRQLFGDKKGVVITRLARGLASGSNLEYADETTLKHALEHRK